MTAFKIPFVAVITILITMFLVACSNGKNHVTEPTGGLSIPEIGFGSPQQSGRSILGMWNVTIDPVTQSVSIEPTDRIADFHFPLNKLYPNVLAITGYGFSPHFWADIRLRHPFPGSGIDGFDPRVIAILRANSGVSMNYPSMGVRGNNRVVQYPDGYTPLFDRSEFSGNVNPFMAYFQFVPYRRWSSIGFIEETMQWDLDLSGFGGPIQFYLVVDVSTNYPAPPQAITDNAREPVSIQGIINSSLNPIGGSARLDMTLTDWQGVYSISAVAVKAPALFDGYKFLSYSEDGPNPDQYIYSVEFTNEKNAPPGVYPFLIAAEDFETGDFICREFQIDVHSDISFNPQNITPEWLNIPSNQVHIVDGIAYFAGAPHDLYIMNVSDPNNPFFVRTFDIGESAFSVYVKDGYAYVTDAALGLQIIDVHDIWNPFLVKTVDTPNSAYGVFVSGGYAYVAESSEFQIIDINPPDQASIIKAVPLVGGGYRVICDRDYAYLMGYSYLEIVDINPPETASSIKGLSLSSENMGFDISSGYAYFTHINSGIEVVDISPPENAAISHMIAVNGYPMDIDIENSIAYVTTSSDLLVYNIQTPGAEYEITSIDAPGYADFVDISGNAGIYCGGSAIGIIYLPNPDMPMITSLYPVTTYAKHVQASGSLLFTSTSHSFQAYDISVPNLTHNLSILFKNLYGTGFDLTEEYAYLAGEGQGLHIVDINPVESMSIINTVPPSAMEDWDVKMRDGYAYVACMGTYGFRVVDIDPPDSAHVVNNISLTGWGSLGIDLWENYALVPNSDSGLAIINIEIPGAEYLVKMVDTPGSATDVVAGDGFAYVADSNNGLMIIDIHDPLSAYIVESVTMPGYAAGVDMIPGYVFVAAGEYGLQIVDIEPPETASIVSSIDTPGYAEHLDVSGNCAYIGGSLGGIQVIQLF